MTIAPYKNVAFMFILLFFEAQKYLFWNNKQDE